MQNWFVYIVRCADDSLYTGIATNLERRVEEHNGQGKPGAKYTRNRQPVVLVYREQLASRSEASKREYQIKQLSRLEKLKLIESSAVTASEM